MALMKNRIAAIRITISRPMWSAIRPAISAPAAAPSRAEATAKPSDAASVLNSDSMAASAPLMTALSYPNRNPPSAATEAIRTTPLPSSVSS